MAKLEIGRWYRGVLKHTLDDYGTLNGLIKVVVDNVTFDTFVIHVSKNKHWGIVPLSKLKKKGCTLNRKKITFEDLGGSWKEGTIKHNEGEFEGFFVEVQNYAENQKPYYLGIIDKSLWEIIPSDTVKSIEAKRRTRKQAKEVVA